MSEDSSSLSDKNIERLIWIWNNNPGLHKYYESIFYFLEDPNFTEGFIDIGGKSVLVYRSGKHRLYIER